MDEEEVQEEVSLDIQAQYFYHIKNLPKSAEAASDAIKEKKEKCDPKIFKLFAHVYKTLFYNEKERYNFYEKEMKLVEQQIEENKNKNEKKDQKRSRREREKDVDNDSKLKKQRIKDLLSSSREKCIAFSESVTTTLHSVSESIVQKYKEQLHHSESACEIIIFCKKTAADFFRYRLELLKYKGEIEETMQSCETYYKHGLEISKYVDYLNPYKLALELNYGVFLFENKNDLQGALDFYKNILANIPSGSNQSKDTVRILQQMDVNITLWESNTEVKDNVIPEIEEEDFDF